MLISANLFVHNMNDRIESFCLSTGWKKTPKCLLPLFLMVTAVILYSRFIWRLLSSVRILLCKLCRKIQSKRFLSPTSSEKCVPPYPAFSKHIMSEFSISKSKGPCRGHDKRHGLFFLRTAFCLSEPRCHLSFVIQAL